MSFCQTYHKNKVSEWKPLYIDFDLLKAMLEPFSVVDKQFKETKGRTKSQGTKSSFTYYQSGMINEMQKDLLGGLMNLEQQFVCKLEREIIRCDQFYQLHLGQLQIKFKKLNYNVLAFLDDANKQNSGQHTSDYYKLRRVAEITYLDCRLLKEFGLQNQKAIKKLLKLCRGNVFFDSSLNQTGKATDEIEKLWKSMKMIEGKQQTLYIQCLSKSNKALSKLKHHNQYEALNNTQSFQMGFYIGFTVCLFIYIVLSRLELISFFNEDYDLYFPMFRGLGLFITYYWLLILCVYCWQVGHVGYRQILGFTYHSSSVTQLLKRAAFISMLFFIVLILCLLKDIAQQQQLEQDKYWIGTIAQAIPLDPALGPLILWIIILMYMLVPSTKVLNGKGRLYFGRVVWTSLLAGVYPCEFVNAWGTDQLLSLVVPIKDLAYTVCFYYNYFIDEKDTSCADSKNIGIGLIIILIPVMLRFIQIGRSIYDQGSYTRDDLCVIGIYIEVFCVFTFSFLGLYSPIFTICWMISCTCLGLTTIYWDVKKDWHLGQPNLKHPVLRKQLAYQPIFYYAAISLNLFFRFAWMLSISPNLPNIIGLWPQFFVMLIATIELCRRTTWNIFRIESVHIKQLGQLKAVPDIHYPYEQIVEDGLYEQWKVDKHMVEPINFSQLNSIHSNTSVRIGSNSTYVQSGATQQQGQSLYQQLRLQITEDNNELDDLVKQEQCLLAQIMLEDRRNESVVNLNYTEFRDTCQRTSSQDSVSNRKILKDVKTITSQLEQ